MNSDTKLLTVADLCDRLHIKQTTAYQKIKNKEIKAFKVGKKILIREEDLQNFLNTCLNN